MLKKSIFFALNAFVISSFLNSNVGIFEGANAAEKSEFESLGDNAGLLEQIKTNSSEATVQVVQNRTVSRKNRSEFLFDYSNFVSGNTYLNTQSFGVGYEFSFNNFVSLGARYFSAYNGVSKEGQSLINNDLPERLPQGRNIVPSLDPVNDGYFITASVYPIYGKVSLFQKIVHFDVYGTGGVGKVNTQTGSKNSYLYGAGMAFWFSNHFSTRVELKNLNYSIKPVTGSQNTNAITASVSVGYLL